MTKCQTTGYEIKINSQGQEVKETTEKKTAGVIFDNILKRQKELLIDDFDDKSTIRK
jgi:hypothetical protein